MTDETDVDRFKRYQDMREDERELVTRLARAQARFGEVRKTKTANAGSYSYRYASLDDIVAAVRPALAEEGVTLSQDTLEPSYDAAAPTTVGVVTVLRYGLAKLWLAEVRLPSGDDPQAVGAALTYARRYSLATALGIAAEEDDDGASAVPSPSRAPAPKTTSGEKKATPNTMKRLHALAAERGITHEQMRDWAGRHLGIETLKELTRAGAVEMERSLAELPVLPREDQVLPDLPLEGEEQHPEPVHGEEGSTDASGAQ